MPRKKKKPGAANVAPEEMWTTFDSNNRDEIQAAMAKMDKASEQCEAIHNGERAAASMNQDYRNSATNTDVRSSFDRSNYDAFRPGEQVPTKPKDIFATCNQVYQRVGIIHNIVDLMSDFGAKGVSIVHPNETIEKFYKDWFTKIGGAHITERFLNLFYRLGTAPIRRKTAKVTLRKAKKYFAAAKPDMKLETDETGTLRNEIPVEYKFLNVNALEVVSNKSEIFLGDIKYGLAVPPGISEEALKQTNLKIVTRNNKKYLELPKEKFSIYHYKKDDWDLWAKPMIYSILDNIMTLEKMRLADMCALDGATSKIRVWKLGDLDHKIMPSDGAVSKFASMILSHTGGGCADFVWTPAIDLLETNSGAHEILGKEKYEPVLAAIHAGLGIPSILSGGEKGGMTNNFLSLKTLIERLEYGRAMLQDFWNHEIELIQKAYGWKLPAKIVFEQNIMSDEASEKALYIQLWDRGLISDELICLRFKEDPMLEEVRIRREEKKRQTGKKPPKAGPYVNADKEHDLKKIALQSGGITPSEVGIELAPRKAGEVPVLDKKAAQVAEKKKTKGVSGEGRPKGKKDSTGRKPRQPKPITNKSKANVALQVWATEAQEKIAELTNPLFLKIFNKKNMRQLSSVEAANAEERRFMILCALAPQSEISNETVGAVATAKLSNRAASLRSEIMTDFLSAVNREPTVAEKRLIYSQIYSMLHGDE